jgi:phosphate:Na+ symporter
VIAGEVVGQSAASGRTVPIETRRKSPGSPEAAAAVDAPAALVRLEQSAQALGELRLAHRSATLGAVATGALTADEAIVRVDAISRYEALARHAWRSAAHLVGRGE